MTAGVDNQVFVGKTPWHGGGTPIPAGSSVEAALLSNRLLSSRIVKCPVIVGAPDRTLIDGVGKYAMVREADNRIVGWGGNLAQPMQHLDLGRFADSLSVPFSLSFDIAGTLREGSQFVLQAKVGDPEVIRELRDGRPDTAELRMTLGTAHDGDAPTEVGFAVFRAECANMTAAAMGEVRKGKRGVRYFSIRHTGDQQAKLDSVAKAMAEGLKSWANFQEFARKAASTMMSLQDFGDFARVIFPDSEGVKSNARAEAKRTELSTLWSSGQGNYGVSAWDAYNAVTEWVNYRAPVRGVSGEADRNLVRVNSSLYGDGAELGVRAEQELRVYVGA